MTGGNPREAIVGSDQMLLSIAICVYRDATTHQVCTFIHVNGGDIYTWQQVSDMCHDLEVTRKRGWKEAYDAFSASSVRKLE